MTSVRRSLTDSGGETAASRNSSRALTTMDDGVISQAVYQPRGATFELVSYRDRRERIITTVLGCETDQRSQWSVGVPAT